MYKKVQHGDLWACACVCLCVWVCADHCDVNNNSFRSPVALSVWRSHCKSSFLQTKHNAKAEEMSFILKICLIQQITFLSILGDCTQLGLSGRADNMWRLSPGFTAWLIMQRGYGGNLLRVRVCAWGYCGYIAGTTVVPHYIHIFNQSTLNFEITLLFHNTTYYFGNT